MIKKFYKFSIFLMLILPVFFLIPSFAQEKNQESITVTTYYPAPYGVYETLRLYPNDKVDVSQPCTVKGEMFMRDSDNSLYVCDGSKWKNVSNAQTLECITGEYRGGKNGFVTNDMFKSVYPKKVDRTALLNDLYAKGYVRLPDEGRYYITEDFGNITNPPDGMILDPQFEPKKEAIYDIIADHYFVGGATTGFVGPNSITDPKNGPSTLQGTNYNFYDVFAVEDLKQLSEGGGWTPIIRCKAENGWIATGCSSHTWGQGGDEDEYMLQNGCKGQQYGDNRIGIRCCRVVNTDKQSFTFYGDSETGTAGRNRIY